MRLREAATLGLLAIGLMGCDPSAPRSWPLGSGVLEIPAEIQASRSADHVKLRVANLRPGSSERVACDGKSHGSGYSLFIDVIRQAGQARLAENPRREPMGAVSPFDVPKSLGLQEQMTLISIRSFSGADQILTFSDQWPLLGCGSVNTCAVGFRVDDLAVVVTCGWSWTKRPTPEQLRQLADDADAAIRRWRRPAPPARWTFVVD
ncbi:MAG: hypothetical protein AB1698_22360 [Pseudomonadota bacterium]|jgi:hypothetical protein